MGHVVGTAAFRMCLDDLNDRRCAVSHPKVSTGIHDAARDCTRLLPYRIVGRASLKRVFEPFHRLEASRSGGTGGVGLGLTIARRFVADQGGTVTLTNRPEGGLLAVVTLSPVSASSAGKPPKCRPACLDLPTWEASTLVAQRPIVQLLQPQIREAAP